MRPTMRLLFLLTQDLESPSGLGRFLPLAQEWVKAGHQVTIAALHADYENLAAKEQTVNGVKVKYLGQMQVLKRNHRKVYFSPGRLLWLMGMATLKLTYFTLRHPASIVYVCKPHPMNSLAGLVGKILGKKRLFLDCDDYETAGNRFSGAWQQRIVRFFENWMPYQAERVTTNTHFTEQRLIRLGVPPAKIIYLPNGVDPARFPAISRETLEALRATLHLCGKRVVVYVGTLSLASHPVDLLVRAFGELHTARPDTVLLLVGGGEDFDTMQMLADELGVRDAVIFTGRVPPDEVGQYYRLGAVSVDPVADDDAARGRSPLKLFESWWCGVPFVSADVGDRRTLVENPPAGILAQPGAVPALADAIRTVLDDPALAAQLQEEGLRRVARFTWARLVQDIIFYEEKL
jgi:glycosyltransferase involved in cell wall biosynthesis